VGWDWGGSGVGLELGRELGRGWNWYGNGTAAGAGAHVSMTCPDAAGRRQDTSASLSDPPKRRGRL